VTTDEKESNAVFRLMWELAKVDGKKPIQLGNTPFDPLTIDGYGINADRLQVAIFDLRELFENAKQFVETGNENQAREFLTSRHPDFRNMRDCMWQKLFQFLVPKGGVERIRRILRTHVSTFSDLASDDELTKRVFAEFDRENISVPKNIKTGRPWAGSYRELKKGTKPYKAVMTTLRRYFAGYTPSGRRIFLKRSGNRSVPTA